MNREDLTAQLESAVAGTWDRGWQPADLLHALRRELPAPALGALRSAMAVQASAYAVLGRRVAPEWMAQLESVGAAPRRVADLAVDELSVRQALVALRRLPRLHPLAPPPSQWHEGMATRTDGPPPEVPEGLLAKVRALLAKAESTSFNEEAAAFMAKAQELMTRHRIDRAMLADRDDGPAGGPGGRRILIDDPYAQAKFFLLDAVAQANTVRAVWSKGLDFATVMGFATDLDVVEELFTSLLVQATSAMAREGSKTDAFGRSRTRRFRKAFLLAYASRIGQRLEEAAEATVHEAEQDYGTALLPVLAARDEQVAQLTDEVFPELSTVRVTVSDAEGWHAGTTHADLADLSSGAPLRR